MALQAATSRHTLQMAWRRQFEARRVVGGDRIELPTFSV